MPYQCVRHADVFSFADRATPWLLQAEPEHNLMLGLIELLKRATKGSGHPPYLVTVEENGHVCGCALRTPPYKLSLTRMPHGAIPELVNDVAQVYQELPAVLGTAPVARAFGEAWAIFKNVQCTPGKKQRIYELRQVTWPEPLASGELRLAEPNDSALMQSWLDQFSKEAGVDTINHRSFMENHIHNKTAFIWEDEGTPRTSALYSGKTPNGVRVGFVYTPQPHRRRGYASACVAALSQRALDGGNQFCCLYTDLSNPTSNSIYQQIGYTPVSDVMDYNFS